MCKWQRDDHFYDSVITFFCGSSMDFQHRREETFSPELEQKILEMTESDPAFSYLCLSRQLGLVGVGVSPSPVRYVWQWDGSGLALPRAARAGGGRGAPRRGPRCASSADSAANSGALNNTGKRRNAASSPGDAPALQRRSKTSPRFECNQWSRLRGHRAWRNSISTKLPMTAVDVFNDRALPFYEGHKSRIRDLPIDNGREFRRRQLPASLRALLGHQSVLRGPAFFCTK